MSDKTKIQWCDTTVNPIMGCGGCELFPSPSEILEQIDRAVAATGVQIESRTLFKALVTAALSRIIDRSPKFSRGVTTTNIWHFRDQFTDALKKDYGATAADAAVKAIRQGITCYAAKLHLNKGTSIANSSRNAHKGYAPTFERVTRFAGRAAQVAKLPDLRGQRRRDSPWKGKLPRMIFVSDMGDALSAEGDYSFLRSDLMPAIKSEAGRSHLWLWLTKRPGRMAKFADLVGGFPANVCAMTTVTGPDKLERIDDLRRVNAAVRGLSIEPLWNRIPADELDLAGIDWVIVGGESGSGEDTRPFALEWAEELRDLCKQRGVAFFLKQLGRNPSWNDQPCKLRDKHGGDWTEWRRDLRCREFPNHFYTYRGVQKL